VTKILSAYLVLAYIQVYFCVGIVLLYLGSRFLFSNISSEKKIFQQKYFFVYFSIICFFILFKMSLGLLFIGVFGQPSITTTILAFYLGSLAFSNKRIFAGKEISLVLFLVAIFGSVLYFSILFIPYQQIYNLMLPSSELVLIVLIAVSLLFFLKLYLVATILFVSIFCQMLGLYNTINLWSYLIDANIWIFSLFYFFIKLIVVVKAKYGRFIFLKYNIN
jgi:hypothetical protein